MATTDSATKNDIGFVSKLIQYHPKYKLMDKNTIDIITEDGLWQRDRLAEIVIAASSNNTLKHSSQQGFDLIQIDENQNQINIIDVKTTTVRRYTRSRKRKNNKIYTTKDEYITIIDVQTKNCELRIIAYDPIKNHLRFFIVWEYSNIKSIKIPVNSNNSKYINGQNGIELNSIYELAQYIPPHKSKKDIKNILQQIKSIQENSPQLKIIKQEFPGIIIDNKQKNTVEIKYAHNTYSLTENNMRKLS
jgi:hypothetical protein